MFCCIGHLAYPHRVHPQAQHLVSKGVDVHVLDPWEPGTGHGSRVDGATYHKADMLSLEGWPPVLDGAWAVIHLAAVNPCVPLSLFSLCFPGLPVE